MPTKPTSTRPSKKSSTSPLAAKTEVSPLAAGAGTPSGELPPIAVKATPAKKKRRTASSAVTLQVLPEVLVESGTPRTGKARPAKPAKPSPKDIEIEADDFELDDDELSEEPESDDSEP